MIDNWHSSLLWHLVQTACTCLVRNCVVQCIPVHWNQCVNCSCLLQHVVIHAHLALVPVKWSVHNCTWSLVGKVVVHLQFLALRPHIRSELDRNPWICNLHAYYPFNVHKVMSVYPNIGMSLYSFAFFPKHHPMYVYEWMFGTFQRRSLIYWKPNNVDKTSPITFIFTGWRSTSN